MSRLSRSVRPAGLAALIGLSAVAPSFQTDPLKTDPSAVDHLRKLLSNQRTVDCVRFEYRKDLQGAEWLLKVQIAKRKGVMVTVINPISRSGVVSIDDGKLFQIYSRDEDVLRIQSSPFQMQPTVEWRMKLIEQNYRIRFGGTEEIGGQTVRALEMHPVHDPVPARTFYFERAHDTVLKYVVAPDDGDEFVVFEAKSVAFGRERAEQGFGLPGTSESSRIVKEPPPIKLTRLAEAKPRLGFTPRVPSKLPFGFKVTGTYLYGADKKVYADVKLSDGMASLTVHQWIPNEAFRRPMISRGSPQDEDRYGVHLAVSEGTTDHLPDDVLDAVLQAFLRSAE